MNLLVSQGFAAYFRPVPRAGPGRADRGPGRPVTPGEVCVTSRRLRRAGPPGPAGFAAPAGGGPGCQTNTTTVFMYNLKESFIGEAAAMSIVNFALIIVIVLVYLRISNWGRAGAS